MGHKDLVTPVADTVDDLTIIPLFFLGNCAFLMFTCRVVNVPEEIRP